MVCSGVRAHMRFLHVWSPCAGRTLWCEREGQELPVLYLCLNTLTVLFYRIVWDCLFLFWLWIIWVITPFKLTGGVERQFHMGFLGLDTKAQCTVRLYILVHAVYTQLCEIAAWGTASFASRFGLIQCIEQYLTDGFFTENALSGNSAAPVGPRWTCGFGPRCVEVVFPHDGELCIPSKFIVCHWLSAAVN